MPNRTHAQSARTARPAIEVVAAEDVGAGTRARAVQKVRRAADHTSDAVLYGRVKLWTAPDPAVDRPAIAEATLDVNGQLVRAHVAAHTLAEAIDLLEDRLRDRLDHRAEHFEARHHLAGTATPGEWRHGQLPSDRPSWFARPAEERSVVRRKTVAPGESTIDEAAFDLAMLGHEFYLFTELTTGVEAVLHRLDGDRYGLRRLRTMPSAPVTAVVDVELEAGGAPTLSLAEAQEWLDLGPDPFVFYADRDKGRGHVLYCRYDGHYGLVSTAATPLPATEPSTARRRLRTEVERLDRVRAVLLAEGLDRESESESVAELSANDQHPADLGTETFERERDLSLLEDVEQEIVDVRRALVRLDRGEYGRCEACGAEIGDERLEAMPAARFCLAHQAASEVIPGLAS